MHGTTVKKVKISSQILTQTKRGYHFTTTSLYTAVQRPPIKKNYLALEHHSQDLSSNTGSQLLSFPQSPVLEIHPLFC